MRASFTCIWVSCQINWWHIRFIKVVSHGINWIIEGIIWIIHPPALRSAICTFSKLYLQDQLIRGGHFCCTVYQQTAVSPTTG